MAERRKARAIAKQLREEAAQQKKERRVEALEQKATEEQLRNEAKFAKRSLKKPTTKLVLGLLRMFRRRYLSL
jgi:hypothetical protein